MIFTVSHRLKSAGNLRLGWHTRVPGWVGVVVLLFEACIYIPYYCIIGVFWLMYGVLWLIALPLRLFCKKPSKSSPARTGGNMRLQRPRNPKLIMIIIGAIFTLLSLIMTSPSTVFFCLAFGLPLLAGGILPRFLAIWKTVLISVGAFVLLFALSMALPNGTPEPEDPTDTTRNTQIMDSGQTDDPATTAATTVATTTTPKATTATTSATTRATTTTTTAATTTTQTTTAVTTTTTAATTAATTTAATTTATTAATTTAATTTTQATTSTTAATTAATTTAATKAQHKPSNTYGVFELGGDNRCRPGETVTLNYYGYPNTSYSISIKLKTRMSEAEGLIPKTSNADGFVSWTWVIGTNTTPGEYDIKITADNDSAMIPFTILGD